MKKRLFLPLLFVALGVFSFAPKSQNTQSVQAEGAATQTLTAQTLVKEVWHNDQADVNKGLFTFGVRHGHVGDANFAPMTKSNTGSGGNMNGTVAFIEWDGARMVSGRKDSIIFAFTAHTRMTVTVSTPVLHSEDWVDNSYLNHYVAPVSYSLIKPTKLTASKTVSDFSTTSAFDATYDLRTGETYFWEWGFEWEGSRNFFFAGAQLQFTIAANDENTAELASLNLNLENVVKNPAHKNNGNFIDTGLVSYGMTFGNVLNNQIATPTINGENYVVNGVSQAWWKLFAGLNSGFAFTFTAKERVNVSMNVANLGGWVEQMQVYYVVARSGSQRIAYSCEGVSPLTAANFSSVPVELVAGETLYFFVTSYGDNMERNIYSDSANDITFKVEEVKQTYNVFALTNDWLNFRANHADFCVLNTEDSATLDSYIVRFNNLTNEEKALVGRVYDSGNYTIADSVNYFTTLNQQSNVASFATSNLTAIFVLILVVAFGVTALFIYKKRNSAK